MSGVPNKNINGNGTVVGGNNPSIHKSKISTPSPRQQPPSFLRRTSPFVNRPKKKAGSPLFISRKSTPAKQQVKVKPEPGSIPSKSLSSSYSSIKQEAKSQVPEKYEEFKIHACVKEEIENIQYHLMKFQAKRSINPSTDFTKPIRLHRKDPKNMQFQLTLKEIDERERINRELKELELTTRAATEASVEHNDQNTLGTAATADENNGNDNISTEAVVNLDEEMNDEEQQVPTVAPEPLNKQQSNIAPDGKKNNKQKKTREVKVYDEETKKLRYEEFYPWVLEDYDGANTFVGNYEAASTMSHNHVLLIPDNGGFKMVPINKIFKFTPRNKYATLTLEEAEAKLRDVNSSVSRWIMSKLDEDEDLNRTLASKRNNLRNHRFKAVSTDNLFGDDDDDDDRNDSDNGGIDFDEEFADDEEAPIVGENDEEEKESRKRMEKEMLSANTGLEATLDVDDKKEDEKKTKFDKEGKKLKKSLVKNEYGQVMYDSDDEENPYLNESDIEDSEDEKTNSSNEKSEKEIEEHGAIIADNVKKENSDAVPHVTQLSIKLPINNPIGIITILANSQILNSFPRGEWNPEVSKKRNFASISSSNDEKPSKRLKNKSTSPVQILSASSPTPSSPTPISGDESDVASVILNEITSLISANELTPKELFASLKDKFSKHKNIMKAAIKDLVKVRTKDDGKKILVLKKSFK